GAVERVCAASIARATTNAPASATSDALQDTRAGMVAPTWSVGRGGARRCAAAAAGTTARASRTAVVRAMGVRSRKPGATRRSPAPDQFGVAERHVPGGPVAVLRHCTGAWPYRR